MSDDETASDLSEISEDESSDESDESEDESDVETESEDESDVETESEDESEYESEDEGTDVSSDEDESPPGPRKLPGAPSAIRNLPGAPSTIRTLPVQSKLPTLKPIVSTKPVPSRIPSLTAAPITDSEAKMLTQALPGVVIAGITRPGLPVRPNLDDLLAREESESATEFEARRRLTYRLMDIDFTGVRLNNVTAVIIGFLIMRKATIGLTYDANVEVVIRRIMEILDPNPPPMAALVQ